GECAGKRLRRAVNQRLRGDRKREHLAAPAVRIRHRREEQAERRARPEPDHRDEAAADDDYGGRAPGGGRTDDGQWKADAFRLFLQLRTLISVVGRLSSPQAGTAAGRTTGFSTIGRLTIAERTPSRIESHHTTSYEPVRSNSRPPSQTPRKPPT